MHQTLYHASWRISRQMTIEPEPQADIVPTGEVRAAISPRSRHRPRRKRAYSGTRANYIGPRGRNIRPAARASARLGNLRYSLAAAADVDPPESDSNHDDHEHPEHHVTSLRV